MKFAIFAGCVLSAFVAAAADSSIYHDGWIDLNKNGKRDVYEDPSRPVKRRVADLLKRMTLDGWPRTPPPANRRILSW